jgi:glyceraldehyde 3-phosphate dehydrogenase
MESVIKNSNYESELGSWIEQEKAAIDLIKAVGGLWFEKSVELIIFRNQLIDRSSSEIMNLHLYAKYMVKQPITVFDTVLLANEMLQLDLAPSRIDIGRLCSEWINEKSEFKTVGDFVRNKLKGFIGLEKNNLKPKDVVLYGFGRIGRLAAREIIAQAGKGMQLRLRAIVTRSNSPEDITKRADLLRTDSVHGPFPGTIIEDLENKALIVNGHTIKMIAAKNANEIDYESFGIKDALLIDNTGSTRDRDGLSLHLQSKGIAKVLLTAPGKGNIPNVVYGVNHNSLEIGKEEIFSAASCTTNGHIETIHSYTNDQNLLDNYHPKYRRGRSAALNMVITETGAGSAITKVLPVLKGKLTANSVRVPTPDVSLAILSLTVNRTVDKESVNDIMKAAALKGDLVEQIQYYYSNELVSTDVIGNPCASVFDSQATLVSEDKMSIVLYVWYDNEYGYTRQVVRLAKYIAEVIPLRYY